VASSSASADVDLTIALARPFLAIFFRPTSIAARLVVSNDSVMPPTASCTQSTSRPVTSGPAFFCGPMLRSSASAPASFCLRANSTKKAPSRAASASFTLGEMMWIDSPMSSMGSPIGVSITLSRASAPCHCQTSRIQTTKSHKKKPPIHLRKGDRGRAGFSFRLSRSRNPQHRPLWAAKTGTSPYATRPIRDLLRLSKPQKIKQTQTNHVDRAVSHHGRPQSFRLQSQPA